MKINLIKSLKSVKASTVALSTLSPIQKKRTLQTLIKILEKNKEEIFMANTRDVERSKSALKSKAFINRLAFSEDNFKLMLKSIKEISEMDDSLGEIIEKRIISNGVIFCKKRVSLGVAAVIYESRPNLTIEVFALCFKSGNSCVLKGGSESIESNRILYKCIKGALEKNNICKDIIFFLDNIDHKDVSRLLKQEKYIDVVIPRGGYGLVRKVVNEAKIPVLYHSEGGARIFIDKSADLQMALQICVNAKTSRPATCNSLDTVLVHKEIANNFLPELEGLLKEKMVTIIGDRLTRRIIDAKPALKRDYETEFLDLVLCIKVVNNINEAIEFITKYTNRHSEGIVTKDKKNIDLFVDSIDAAGVFINCSTRLHDGGVMGFGAEMGISTGKLHARGPVALKELTTYKWIAYGEGQIRV